MGTTARGSGRSTDVPSPAGPNRRRAPGWCRLLLASLALGSVLLTLTASRAGAAGNPSSPAGRMIEATNRVRAQAGLPALIEDPVLDAVAAERSSDMAANRYLSHVTLSGQTVFELLQERGVAFRLAGENLSWSAGYGDKAIPMALQGFLDSPPHRDNLLNPSFQQVGVGVAQNGREMYLTLVLVQRGAPDQFADDASF